MRNFLDELTILDRPALGQPQWLIDMNRVNELPTPAIVAILQSIDLDRFAPEEFRAIVQWIDDAVRDRQKRKTNGS